MPLYVVATPLGNLEDITRRATRILGEVDEVLAEDTRHSRKLLDAIGVRTRVTSYHDHSPEHVVGNVVARLLEGRSIALVTDAGTPCISDPGFALVRAAQDAGVAVVPVPGPSAFIAFLSAAGLPTDRFEFLGFFARKDGERRAQLEHIVASTHTVVGYESPQRLVDWLTELVAIAPEREVAIGRELTKLHEEIRRGTASSLLHELSSRDSIRGEVVLGIAPAEARSAGDEEVDAWLRDMLPLGLRPRDLSRVLAKRLGRRADDIYARALALRGGD